MFLFQLIHFVCFQLGILLVLIYLFSRFPAELSYCAFHLHFKRFMIFLIFDSGMQGPFYNLG